MDTMAYVQAVAATKSNVNTGVGGPGFTSLDGVSLTTNVSHILLLSQTTSSENGVWLYKGQMVQMTRPTGATEQYKTATKLDNATLVWVTGGVTLAGTVWGVAPA